MAKTIRLSIIAVLAFWALAYYEVGVLGMFLLVALYVGLAIMGAVVSGVLGYFMRSEVE